MNRTLSILLLAGVIGLAGCAQPGQPGISKQTGGAAVGGVLGGVLGSQVGKGHGTTAAIIGGTLLGAYLGGQVGKTMDQVDQMNMQQAIINTPQGSQATWTNQQSGSTYTVTPVNSYQSGGNYCREFNTTVNVGGKIQKAYGTACRQPDGSWKVVNQQ